MLVARATAAAHARRSVHDVVPCSPPPARVVPRPARLLWLLLAGAPAAALPRGGHELTVVHSGTHLGAALDPLFPQPPIDTTQELVAAPTEVWHQVLATDFATRAEALAAEIAAAEPLLVGLQEVTLTGRPVRPDDRGDDRPPRLPRRAAGGAGRARAALPRRGRPGGVRRGGAGARLAGLRRRDRTAGRRPPHRPRRDSRAPAGRGQSGRLGFGRLRERAGAPVLGQPLRIERG